MTKTDEAKAAADAAEGYRAEAVKELNAVIAAKDKPTADPHVALSNTAADNASSEAAKALKASIETVDLDAKDHADRASDAASGARTAANEAKELADKKKKP